MLGDTASYKNMFLLAKLEILNGSKKHTTAILSIIVIGPLISGMRNMAAIEWRVE